MGRATGEVAWGRMTGGRIRNRCRGEVATPEEVDCEVSKGSQGVIGGKGRPSGMGPGDRRCGWPGVGRVLTLGCIVVASGSERGEMKSHGT